MADAVELAALVGTDEVNHVLGITAAAGRFAEDDLAAIVRHLGTGTTDTCLVIADENHSAQPAPRCGPTSASPRRPPDERLHHHAEDVAARGPHRGTDPYAHALPACRRPEVLATARTQHWHSAEPLRVLLAEEIRGRDGATKAARRKTAGLPAGKTFNTWREADSSIPAPTKSALAGLEWVRRAEYLVISGTSRTGKTNVVEARDHDVIDAGVRVSCFALESLTAALARAAVDDSQSKVFARITAAELIVVDDIGMLPSGQADAKAFYRLVDATYDRRSLTVTSNLHAAGFNTFMPDTLATTAVDRLLNHAHVIVTEGTSLRLAEAAAGKGVVLLH